MTAWNQRQSKHSWLFFVLLLCQAHAIQTDIHHGGPKIKLVASTQEANTSSLLQSQVQVLKTGT